MSRSRVHLSVVIDEVLTDANAATRRHADEVHAIKVAAAAPRTDLARGFRALADTIRADRDDITYADLAGIL